MRKAGCVVLLAIAPLSITAAQDTTRFTHADTLRGANSPARAWWDVAFYDLHVRVEPRDSSISGWNGIVYRVLRPARELQVDLQVPLEVDSMVQSGARLVYRRDGNAFFVTLRRLSRAGALDTITVYYHGKPRVARRPPWDGGFIWAQDSLGHTWVATANARLGALTLDFWPLAYHADTARVQFQQAKSMLKCFESWFGPYPWYQDGYKLVESPHLGMEHQSAVAYGNHYQNGYRGRDLSGTGTGLGWDFIIVHESAHEWWGNSITMQDQADMWIHEGFANYAENLYVECLAGKAAGARYVIGTRRGIRNDRPIIPRYGVNAQGSGDMYPKSGNMLHTIRQLVADDAKWRGVLRGLNRTFWHRTVTSQQVEDYMIRETGLDLAAVFREYLTTTQIPVLEYRLAGDTLAFHWANVVPGFAMPVRATVADSSFALLHPTEAWQTTVVHLSRPEAFQVDENFYVEAKPAAHP